MDNSSRNIVKFIATITIAALLIMGARYYALSQKTPKPVETAEKVAPPETPATEFAEPPVEEVAADPQDPAGNIIEEDADITMGEPSMNLEQGGTQSYAPPPAQSQPPSEPQPDQ